MSESTKQRKPIYDEAPPSQSTQTSPSSSPKPITVGPSPTDRLATQIRRVRLTLHTQAAKVEDAANRSLDQAFTLEHNFTNTVASLAPSRQSGEKVLPAGIYVLVAAMGASILTRNRNILLRATVPLAVGIGAANYVLPVTSRNVGGLVWKWEQKWPVVADTHARAQERIERFVRTGLDHTRMSGDIVKQKVGGVRERVEEWVAKGR